GITTPYPAGFPTVAYLSRLGVMGCLDALSGLLKQPANQGIGRLEDSRAHPDLQLSHSSSMWVLGLKAADQSLDFFFLSEEEFWRVWFFFESTIPSRVSSITRSAY